MKLKQFEIFNRKISGQKFNRQKNKAENDWHDNFVFFDDKHQGLGKIAKH